MAKCDVIVLCSNIGLSDENGVVRKRLRDERVNGVCSEEVSDILKGDKEAGRAPRLKKIQKRAKKSETVQQTDLA